MQNDNKEPNPARVKWLLAIGLMATFLGGIIPYLYFANRNHGLGWGEVAFVGPVLLIALLMIPVLFRTHESAKLRLPVEDERSKAINNRAGALTFYASLYIWLAIIFFGEDRLTVSQAGGAAIMASAIVFLVLMIVLPRRAAK